MGFVFTHFYNEHVNVDNHIKRETIKTTNFVFTRMTLFVCMNMNYLYYYYENILVNSNNEVNVRVQTEFNKIL